MVTDVSRVGFLSYSTFDNAAHDGLIAKLVDRLSTEVESQTGEPFPIFRDKADLLAGQRWLRRIEEAVDTSSLLIVVMSPKFFRSDVCREEVELFRQRERALSVDDLVIPIYFIRCAEIDEPSEDEVATDLRARHYVDWTDMRFEDLSHPSVRRRIADVAEQIVVRLEEPIIETESHAVAPEAGKTGVVTEVLGPAELLIEMQEAFPLFNEALGAMGSEFEQVASITVDATADLEKAKKRPNPHRAQLASLQRFAQRMAEPAENIEVIALEYKNQLMRIDAGVDAMTFALEQSDDPEDLETAQKLLVSLGELGETAKSGVDAVQRLLAAMATSKQWSSTIRPPLDRIESGVQPVIASLGTIRSWEVRMAKAVARRSGDLGDAQESKALSSEEE